MMIDVDGTCSNCGIGSDDAEEIMVDEFGYDLDYGYVECPLCGNYEAFYIISTTGDSYDSPG